MLFSNGLQLYIACACSHFIFDIECILSKVLCSPGSDNLDDEDAELFKLTNPDDITIPSSYKGPHIRMPLSMNQVESLIDHLKRKQVNIAIARLLNC